jgi:hypothetical protein
MHTKAFFAIALPGACAAVLALAAPRPAAGAPAERRLPVKEYRDKMRGGWMGQMAGVTWGAPTENRFRWRIMPEAPKWKPEMVNGAFGQDDLYVEMTFLRTLEQHGLDVSIRQAGIDFANSRYMLWCANEAGRNNLRNGIAPPDSSHPQFHNCPNEIDYQIEADYSGLIAPGLPCAVVALGEKFGRLMNYGDGLYAGQFIGAMYAEAFFETDMRKVIEAALACIPGQSEYAEMTRDMLAWSKENPEWEKTWDLATKKWTKRAGKGMAGAGGIDCRPNGAYVLMGMLYGKGDPLQTMAISMRCGLDSDCNPSSSGGVLLTSMGASKIPAGLMAPVDEKPIFSHTAYSFPALLAVCEKLARQVVVKEGGRIEKDASGEEVFVIPVKPAKPSEFVQSWAPGPIAGSRYTEAEMDAIVESAVDPAIQQALNRMSPGWKVFGCHTNNKKFPQGVRKEERGKKNVVVTHPAEKENPCILTKKLDVPAGKQTALLLSVTHQLPAGDWDLIVRADGKELLKQTVSKETVKDGWLDARVDLTPFAGKTVRLQLLNQPTGFDGEGAYWGRLEIESKP